MAVLEKYCIKNCWEVRLSLHVENMCGYGCYYVWLVVLSTLEESISMIGLLVVTSKAITQMPMIDNAGCLVVLVASTSTTGTTTSSSVP